jgi:segregation and condensation protein B
MKELLEAYLFVATEPIMALEVAKVLQYHPDDVRAALDELVEEYAARGGGLQIVRLAHGYQMATREEYSEEIAKLLDPPGSRYRLSKPALETLAIIAYRQPITAAEVESVRGVAADGVLKTLYDKKMVYEHSRKQVPGRPILYATTPDFLHYFGLESLEHLPPIDLDTPDDDEQARHVIEKSVGFTEEE